MSKPEPAEEIRSSDFGSAQAALRRGRCSKNTLCGAANYLFLVRHLLYVCGYGCGWAGTSWSPGCSLGILHIRKNKGLAVRSRSCIPGGRRRKRHSKTMGGRRLTGAAGENTTVLTGV